MFPQEALATPRVLAIMKEVGKKLTPLRHQLQSGHTAVRSRIQQKMHDYATYRFTSPQACAINIFFDLSQEFENPEYTYVLTVFILHMFFQYEAEFYRKDNQDNMVLATPAINPEIIGIPELRPVTWHDALRYYIPVCGRGFWEKALLSQKGPAEDEILGILVLYKNKYLKNHDLLFLEKFANRVGFCLHNKILALRNTRHLLFLRKIAHDIGHNIITPNMRLKYMVNQLDRQIDLLDSFIKPVNPPDETGVQVMRVILHSLKELAKKIDDGFTNNALFLESLLRQSHFDLGHYVLRRVRMDIRNQVVKTQFERYRSLFEERGLLVDKNQPELPETPCWVLADLGLISQVLANFLNNAVKYTTPFGNNALGTVRCRVETIPTAFGEDAGVKVTVFSSGAHIPADEAVYLFNDNFRAVSSKNQTGTGHGLYFVREIIAEHNGRAGYEPAEGGNNFYFILPCIK